jgi:hypothetical protein
VATPADQFSNSRAVLRLSVADTPRVDAFIELLRSVERAYLGYAAIDYAIERADWPENISPSNIVRDLEGFVWFQYPLVVTRIQMESPGLLDLAGKAIDILRIAARVRRRLGAYGEAEIDEKLANAEDKRAHAELQRELARLVRIGADNSELDLRQRLSFLTEPEYADQVMRPVERRLQRLDRAVDGELITGAEVRTPTVSLDRGL